MTVKYLHEFIDEFLSLDRSVQKQIKRKLDELSRAPAGAGVHHPLKGDQFKGLFKLRVGDWRLIYRLAEGEAIFVTLGHRSDVYE